jgi:DNA-binding CsgD family transcriptional regulator
MWQFLMVFYVLFFATGFMGGAVLLLLNVRLGGNRLLRPLLLFQVLFMSGMGLILLYFSLPEPPTHSTSLGQMLLLGAINSINAAVWVVVIVLIERAVPRGARRGLLPGLAVALAGAITLKSVANVVVTIVLPAVAASAAWRLGGHILSATAMAAFGMVLRSPSASREFPELSPLVRAFGVLTIIFAPIGLVEYAAEATHIPWLGSLSLDHLFYLAWNVVSVGVAIRLFRESDRNDPGDVKGPEDRAQELGLSGREAEIALLIGRGLTNKEIAAELCISSGTVRTHVYNLYRKAGVSNRVELANLLRHNT